MILHRTILWLFVLSTSLLVSQNPGAHWMQYATPEDGGWSSQKLAEARKFAEESGSSAFMIIYKGIVVDSWGQVERRFMCHSARKSLLTTLYGFYVDQGLIDLDQTLADLSIDDIHNLTDQEKGATIRQLLQARSGVYHPAAYETEAMKAARPARGSHAPGTFWYYNNWDFNTSCHILMQHTGVDFFEDFKQKLANPLQMEDFRLRDCYYHLEEEHSKYPAYPFRMSARDLARIGQLFIQDGQWDGEQMISKEWIDECTTAYSQGTREDYIGYGYMWWINYFGDERFNYSARGVGNQAIIVYPEEDIVMVNRADTYRGESVSSRDLTEITRLVFDAKIGEPNPEAQLMPMPISLEEYTGDFTDPSGNEVQVTLEAGFLLADTPSGSFKLIRIGKDEFMLEDALYWITFVRDEEGVLNGNFIVDRRRN